MKDKILILGASGQLGGDLKLAFEKYSKDMPLREELDICNESKVAAYISKTKPDVVINSAAYNDVKAAEYDPQIVFAANAHGPENIAAACKKNDARLVHISTDYVFDGEKKSPYTEEDVPNPLMAYGKSKFKGEKLALAESKDTLIIRTCGLFGKNKSREKKTGRNFVSNIIKAAKINAEVKVVDDQFCCPTCTRNLAAQIEHLIKNDAPAGIYHAVNTPGTSWYDFACLIFDFLNIDTPVIPVKSHEFYKGFKRPADSRLENTRLEKLDLNIMGTLKTAVGNYLKDT